MKKIAVASAVVVSSVFLLSVYLGGDKDVVDKVSSLNVNDEVSVPKVISGRDDDIFSSKKNRDKFYETEDKINPGFDFIDNKHPIIKDLSVVDSDIGRLFLDIPDIHLVDFLGQEELKELNDSVAKFFVDHDVVRMINEDLVSEDDRDAISRIFQYTTLIRKKISENGIASLKVDMAMLKRDIESGELPMPEPISLAERQEIEDRVKEKYENLRLEREAKRKKEDEDREREALALSR